MLKKITRVLTITLTIMILVLLYRVLGNIKIKKEANTFNELNEKYINRDEETEIIEYKSGTLDINIAPIKKTNPNIDMWEVNIKIDDASQIK